MPEMHFRIEWPNGQQEDCYSPSWVIEEHLEVGAEYPVAEFLNRAEAALQIASERVRARYGFACSAALDQLGKLREAAAELPSADAGSVRVISFIKHAARDARSSEKS
jgi:uncharacterized repeat protein (TIGR04042 family)